MGKHRSLMRPRRRQAMQHVVQGDGIETRPLEGDRLQHVGLVDFRMVARDATRGARETVGVEVKKCNTRCPNRKSRPVQKIAGPHAYFEMIVAEMSTVRGKDSLVRAAPYPGAQSA